MPQRMSMERQAYSVPIIQPDLRREETIQQITFTLQQLQSVSNDIFNRILQRVETNRSQLKNINDRVSLAQAKIEKVKGSKKAIKVFSSAKYPAPERLQEYTSIFSGADDSWSEKRARHKIQSKHRPLDEQAMQEKLKYYPVYVSLKGQEEEAAEEGLGSLPRNINSVSSLLLFNTTENLYKKYVFLDPLAGVVTRTNQPLEGDDEDRLFAAPLSISKREQLERQTAENYFYVPDLGEVPEIDVPYYLPDLPGVADDLMYSADLGPGIAPSAPGGPIPELPTFSTEEIMEPSRADAQDGRPLPPPPPPPPPPPVLPPISPPAPPVLPPSQSTLPAPSGTDSATVDAAAIQGAPKEVVKPSDGRASLLESIRQAGGIGKAKLRNVKEKKLEKKKMKEQEQVNATGVGGDMMSDLFNKLAMRRKGISGKGPAAGSGDSPAGAFARISDTIPPLPPPQVTPGEADEDEWES